MRKSKVQHINTSTEKKTHTEAKPLRSALGRVIRRVVVLEDALHAVPVIANILEDVVQDARVLFRIEPVFEEAQREDAVAGYRRKDVKLGWELVRFEVRDLGPMPRIVNETCTRRRSRCEMGGREVADHACR